METMHDAIYRDGGVLSHFSGAQEGKRVADALNAKKHGVRSLVRYPDTPER